jgi:hypothetical protein
MGIAGVVTEGDFILKDSLTLGVSLNSPMALWVAKGCEELLCRLSRSLSGQQVVLLSNP